MHLVAHLYEKRESAPLTLLLNAKGATRKPPPVCLSGDQNMCSRFSTTFERLLLPTRSTTKRMFAELSPSSELLLSPISAPVPQSWVVVAVVVRSQIKRGANDSCALLSATVSASSPTPAGSNNFIDINL